MTTYRKEYSFTDEQKRLLRDLLIYLISNLDLKKELGRIAPHCELAVGMLHELSNDKFRVCMDNEMIVMDEVEKLCKPVSDEIRHYYEHHRRIPEKGLTGILALYHNDVIEGLKKAIYSSEMYMGSYSSFCDTNEESDIVTFGGGDFQMKLPFE